MISERSGEADDLREIRSAVQALCAEFPAEYHREIDEQRGYPEAFVDALTKAGWLAALIPEEYGGSGLGLTEASVIMEEINRSGGNSGACHGQMYNMNTLVRHGSEEHRRKGRRHSAELTGASCRVGRQGAAVACSAAAGTFHRKM
jgi:acyl-CoA dehydrogenase